ncbi:fimbrial protein [Burkholderia sp. BE17]|uniref:fimbrial protein n=1 Tax=Burkholderia sp. BE17 TaxID=2656644 RepID=UPI00128E39D6|nr:fimbrial protein [Burkholderia sp. BE17]MPV69572.1 fimbrial protein [Burkholderia sp. BE17]
MLSLLVKNLGACRAYRNARKVEKSSVSAKAVAILVLTGAIPSIANAVSCSTPHTLNMEGPSSISLDPSVPIGAVLWKGTVLAGSSIIGNCPSGEFTWVSSYKGTNEYLGKNIYATGVQGVGMKIRWAPRAEPSGFWPASNYQTTTLNPSSAAKLEVQLVKTGSVGAGQLIGIFGENNGTGGQISGLVWNFRWSAPIILVPKTPTCTVATPSIAVPLGAMPKTIFKGVGSTSNARPFDIKLTCSGGDPGYLTAVYVTLTDNTRKGNETTTLSLIPESTATGVGIQVLRNNGTALVAYGPDSNVLGNTNQWLAGSTGNGSFNIPLSARYVQSAPTVTPGKADGRATFTMSYQ